MQPPQLHSRINLADMKAQIVKKLGPEGSKQYFYYLNMFLSLKLTKVEFNKLCLRLLGRENIPLHNQLIRSILKNASSAKLPPTSQKDTVLKHGSNKDVSGVQNGAHTGLVPGLSNGVDMPPLSPRNARTGFRDRRSVDRRSALGTNGNVNFAPPLSAVMENGELNPHDAKMSALRSLPDGSAPCSNDQGEVVVRDDSDRIIPLQAPLGLPLCPVNISGACRALPQTSSIFSDGVLSDSPTLKERMEQIAAANGLQGVSIDSANLLNHGLDSYMKGLIRSCIELVGSGSGSGSGSRSGHALMNNPNKNHNNMKLINGMRPGHQYQIQNSGKPLEVQEQRVHEVSLQDFRVAMELNPRKLGEDWPLLLEKICTVAFEE